MQSQDKNNQAEKVEALRRVYSAHGEYQSSAKKFIQVSNWQQGCSAQYRSAAIEAAQKARILPNSLDGLQRNKAAELRRSTTIALNRIAQQSRRICNGESLPQDAVTESLDTINPALANQVAGLQEEAISVTPKLWRTNVRD